MDAEQMARISAEVMATMNLPPERQAIVDRYTRRIVNKILIRCNRGDMPTLLELIAAEIVQDAIRADVAVPEVEAEKDVSSISRGDTSIHYRDKGTAIKNTEAFLRDYNADLTPFKKMRLPRDVHE